MEKAGRFWTVLKEIISLNVSWEICGTVRKILKPITVFTCTASLHRCALFIIYMSYNLFDLTNVLSSTVFLRLVLNLQSYKPT